jgi:hypothetical protein
MAGSMCAVGPDAPNPSVPAAYPQSYHLKVNRGIRELQAWSSGRCATRVRALHFLRKVPSIQAPRIYAGQQATPPVYYPECTRRVRLPGGSVAGALEDMSVASREVGKDHKGCRNAHRPPHAAANPAACQASAGPQPDPSHAHRVVQRQLETSRLWRADMVAAIIRVTLDEAGHFRPPNHWHRAQPGKRTCVPHPHGVGLGDLGTEYAQARKVLVIPRRSRQRLCQPY